MFVLSNKIKHPLTLLVATPIKREEPTASRRAPASSSSLLFAKPNRARKTQTHSQLQSVSAKQCFQLNPRKNMSLQWRKETTGFLQHFSLLATYCISIFPNDPALCKEATYDQKWHASRRIRCFPFP